MKSCLKIFAVLLTATQTVADETCDDLWLARNIIYDAHGYCFGSPLGKAVFDNSDCETVDPELPEDLAQRVTAIWTAARSLNCAVDQTQSNISVYNKSQRMKFMRQPIAIEKKSVCFGAQPNTEIPLFTDQDETKTPVAKINIGDTVGWFHQTEGDWAFATLLNKAEPGTIASGWTKQASGLACAETAG